MRYWYDWEFLEDGKTIDPISVGIVAEDGRNLYLINAEFDLERYQESTWLMDNVVPHLPITVDWHWDTGSDEYQNHATTKAGMRHQIELFFTGDRNVELWGYYAAYDHICLAQLFGSMIKMPSYLPMFTHDLMQLDGHRNWHDLAFNLNPHHALFDAQWTRDAHLEWLRRNREFQG